MNDWQHHHRPGGLGTPLREIPKRKKGDGDQTQWMWAIVVAIACLIGWAVADGNGVDSTVQCIAPSTNCG
jgi:hypothetical protein